MQASLAQLPALLRNAPPPVWLVAGEELLLMQEALDAIRAAARARGFAEREVLDVERGFDWQQVHDACNAMSLFAAQRIVEVRIPNAPDAAGAAALTALARKPAPDVLLIVACGKLDGRQRKGAWYSALERAGAALYVDPVRIEALPAWIGARLTAVGLKAQPEALQRLARLTEGNLLAAAQEVGKLALLHPAGTQLGEDDIETAVADSAHEEVYGWIDKVLAGDGTGAARGLERLRDEGVEIPAITGPLAFDLRKLVSTTSAYARSRNAGAAVEGVWVAKPRQAAFAKATARLAPAEVRTALRTCARIDAGFKSTNGRQAAWEELLTWALAASGAAHPPNH